ncbi:ribonuclease H-like domain-containing protein [Tanacetum coccineum]
MISTRLKKFYKKTGRKVHFDAKEPVGFDKTKVECFNCHNTRHFARECRSKGNQESRRRDAGNTGYKAKDNGRRPGKQEEPKALVTLDGDGVDWTGHAEDEQENFALMAYSNSGSDTKVTSCSKECVESYVKLKKLYDEQREQLGDASIEIQAYTQALKKVEAQLVCHQKNQLIYEEKIRFMKIDLDDKTNVLAYHKKLLAEAVKEKEELKTKLENFQSSSKGLSKLLNSQMSARDKSRLGYGNEIHEDLPYVEFTYGLKQSKTSKSAVKISASASCESNSSVETPESIPKPVVNEPKAVSKPKVWSDAPIIEEYESDSDDEYVIKPSKEQEKPSCAFVNTVKHVKTHRETIKEQNTCSTSPKADKRDWNGLMSKKLGLGYGFTKKACFVCGSFSHHIRDYDFHEKIMAKQVELKKQKDKVNTARQNLSSQAAATSTARKVNTTRPIVNEIRPGNNFYKSHSPIRKPSNRTTTTKANFANHKVNIAGDKIVSAVGGNRETAVKTSDDPQKALKNKGIVDSGCSRHMTGNKAYLVEYQDYNGGPITFGGSKGQITGKGKIITGKLDFEDMYFVKELKQFNLFSVSQMCDKKNKVLFTNSECIVLSPDFKLLDENQVLLRVPRQNNMYSFNLENIVPTRGLACLIAKATIDESNKWHRRLGHVNFKNLNKLVKGNLVRGLPLKIFQNDHTCVCLLERKATQGLLKSEIEAEPAQDLLCMPLWSSYTSTVKSSKVKNGDEKTNGDTGPMTNEEPKDQDDQAFLEELERLKRQEKEANDAAEVFRKEFAQCNEELLLQAKAARAASTNTVNTVSTPISTASPSNVFSSVADFINLETTVNIEPKKISQSLEDESWVDTIQEELLQFKIQKMDVKSAFLYAQINERDVGLISRFCRSFASLRRYRRGTIDKTLFIKKDKKDIILVQVYVDDIIFGSTKKSWCEDFEALMKSRFQMSSMGELTFFLGLQVKQKEDGIFISQDKYVAEILKKFNFMNVKTASTPIETHKPLTKDEEAADVDVHLYRSMIDSLMYLTASRPEFGFSVCACSSFR